MCAALTALCCVFLITGFALTQETERITSGLVADVIDGDTLRLSTGREVRLTGIQAPKLPLGRPGFEPWPMAKEAREALLNLALGQTITLHYAGQPEDRYGRLLAQVETDNGSWLQREMISRGMARVYSFADNRGSILELLAAEKIARSENRGLWAKPAYTLRSAEPEGLMTDLGTFQIVEDVVRNTARVRGRVFLNFGEDYRTDFTATIAPEDMDVFEAGGFDHGAYENKKIRVRGWLTSFNGPSMELDHPEQIELVEPD